MWWKFEKWKFLSNPENKHDIQLEKKLYSELKQLGYKFNDSVQFDCFTFREKDKNVVPVLIKYIEKFEHEGLRLQYISALGVKGFDNATEYLLVQYEKYRPPQYNQHSLNIVSQTLARISDLRYLDKYFEFLSDHVTIDACYLVEMFGKLQVKQAISYLIKLLDCVAIIPDNWIGTVLEEQKYFISQSAIVALGKFKNIEYNKYIKKFLNPEQLNWITYEESQDSKILLKSTYREYKKLARVAMQ